MQRYSMITREGFSRIEEDSRGQWVEHDGASARIATLEAQVKALTAERDAQAEAVRVLGLDVRQAAMDRSVNDNWMEDEVSLQVQRNPIARAAVEGGKREG